MAKNGNGVSAAASFRVLAKRTSDIDIPVKRSYEESSFNYIAEGYISLILVAFSSIYYRK
jgi:hypothetical protein